MKKQSLALFLAILLLVSLGFGCQGKEAAPAAEPQAKEEPKEEVKEATADE